MGRVAAPADRVLADQLTATPKQVASVTNENPQGRPVERKRRQNEQPKRAPFREKERAKKECDPNPAKPNRKGDGTACRDITRPSINDEAQRSPPEGHGGGNDRANNPPPLSRHKACVMGVRPHPSAVRLAPAPLEMVGEVGPATSNNFNAVVCPASVKAIFARKRQFPELSSASRHRHQGGPAGARKCHPSWGWFAGQPLQWAISCRR
jgi:hypothetical protein